MVNESLLRNEEIADGAYPLGAPVRRSARSAIYETEVRDGEETIPAVIRIREVEQAETEVLTEHLRKAAELSHPNLQKIYASGSSVLNEIPVVYVVMERADESLEAVLAERPLTESETREMLAPVLEALGYLHKKGYAHTRLRPSNVLAVNDRLKLSADSAIQAHDREEAEDMRALGALIVQALTQKIPNANELRDPREFREIPQPLADMVRHCLDPDRAARWTVEQVQARLNTAALPEDAAENIAVEIPRSHEDPEAYGPAAGMPKWIYAGLAALVLIVLLAAIVRNHHAASVAASIPPAAQQNRQRPAPDPTVAEPRPPVTPRPSTPESTARPDQRKASGWAVIVGAYIAREPAEKRMREMVKKWPAFGITVLESHGEKTPFLLVLGRNLSEDQAQDLRKRAVQSGLPRDTYIKRVM